MDPEVLFACAFLGGMVLGILTHEAIGVIAETGSAIFFLDDGGDDGNDP
jgi:hypothetical protein